MNITRGTWPARRHLKSPDAAMRCDASTVCEPNCTRAATSTDLRQQIPSTKNATARTSLGRRPLRDYAGPAVTNLLALVRQQIAKLRGPVGPDGPIDIYGPYMICRRIPQDTAALPATPELSRTIERHRFSTFTAWHSPGPCCRQDWLACQPVAMRMQPDRQSTSTADPILRDYIRTHCA